MFYKAYMTRWQVFENKVNSFKKNSCIDSSSCVCIAYRMNPSQS